MRTLLKAVTLRDFAESFGTTEDDVRNKCQNLINGLDFSYSIIKGAEREALIVNILKKIETDRQVIGAPERQKIWHDGWAENLVEFIHSDYDLNKLVPKFIRPGQPVRFKKQYIKPSSEMFELSYYSVFRQWLFKTYFESIDQIFEFGCGTGFNLIALAQLYPQKRLAGLDFVKSSVDLVNTIADRCKFNLTGFLFDMLSPDRSFKFNKETAVLTIGSIEQLAGNFVPFLNYLLKQPVSVCVHVEPVIELYDDANLADYLAMKFQAKRGYTSNFLPYLKKLEEQKSIDILKVKRLYFGSLFMEGYNYIVWRPLKQ